MTDLPRHLAWFVPVGVAAYLIGVDPAAGQSGVPYVVALLGPVTVLVAAWAIIARGPVARAGRGSSGRALALAIVIVAATAVLTYLVVRATGTTHVTRDRRLEYSALMALVAVAGIVAGRRTARLPSPTELVIALGLAAMVDMDLYLTGYGFHRDLGIYLRAGHAFLDGRPVYTEVPLTTGSPDPTMSPFVYPPLTLPFFALLALSPLPLAHALWLVATGATTAMSLRCFGVRWRWMAALLLWPPIVQGLWVGNADMLVLVAFAAAPWYPALLAFPPMVKLQLGVTGLWLGRERRWRSLAMAAGIGIALVLATLPMVGIGAWVSWIHALVAFSQTARNIPSTMGIALARYLPSAVAIALGLLAVVAALRWRGRDGLADLGLASLAISPTLYPHGFPVGLPGFLRLRPLAFWTVIALTSTFYRPQDWWLLVLLAFAAPYLAQLTIRRASDGPHPLGASTVWSDAPGLPAAP